MIGIVIPTRNEWEKTNAVVRALARTDPTANKMILVVDDHSTERREVPGATVVPNDGEYWTAAVNTGLRHCLASSCDTLIAMANCVAMETEFLNDLQMVAHQGIVGIGQRLELNLAEWYGQGLHQRGRMWLEGWCFGTSIALWKELGPLDEQMRQGWSDLDFQWRAAEFGVPLIPYFPLGSVHHLWCPSAKALPNRRELGASDRAAFIRKWFAASTVRLGERTELQ